MIKNASVRRLENGLSGMGAFLYGNSYWIIVISVLWALTSIFIVTIGPATLAAYVAILSLNSDRNRIEKHRIVSVVRQQYIPATVFGLLPVLFFGIAVGYLYALTIGVTVIKLICFLMTLYLGIYITLVMIPTFVALAHGRSSNEALHEGVHWVAEHPTAAMFVGILTLLVLIVSMGLTIGFLLLYAGVTFSFQVRIVGDPQT